MRARRLAGMGFAEVATRGRQELSKWLERVGVLRAPGSGALDPAEAGRLAESSRRFFGGASDAATPALVRERFPEDVARLLAAAERILCGRFDLLGHRGLSFGDPVDWRLDPRTGRRTPLVHWSRIDPLDARAVGDVKVIWELNRHQWLVTLGLAHRLTSDERYAEAAVGHLRHWMAANPGGRGINWTSSLEVALRIVAWSWTSILIRRSRALTAETLALLVESIGAHALHVERYLSRYSSPNTHLTGEALGLFYAGTLFPRLPAAWRWRAIGAGTLVSESARQVLDDGVYFEQSTCYQRYTIEIYLHFLILAAAAGTEVEPEVGRRVERMIDFLVALLPARGTSASIGDGDGGSLLPLVERPPEDARGIFAVGAAVFGRADHLWAAGGAAPEVAWLLGPAGLARLDALDPAPPPGPPSRVFPAGGYAVMRSGWDDEAHVLVLDAGPLGCPTSAGHGHADLLSIQCSAFGAPYVVDPGTYCYTADPVWRDFFRGTSAHSTLLVDGVGQAIPAGPFAWRHRPRARLRRWVTTETFDFADADHDAYRRLADGVVHRRRVIFVRDRYWVVIDDVDGAGVHRAEVRYQFAPMPVAAEDPRWVRARHPAGHALLVGAFASVALEVGVAEGDGPPMRGWVSPAFGRRGPAPVVILAARTRLPVRIATMLFPVADASARPPAVQVIAAPGGSLATLVLGDGDELLIVDDQEVVLHRG